MAVGEFEKFRAIKTEELAEAWATLDAAGGGADEGRPRTPPGKVGLGEFGLFMRRGEHVHREYYGEPPQRPWRERVLSERRQKADEGRATLDRRSRRDLGRSMEGAPRARDDPPLLAPDREKHARLANIPSGLA